MGRRTIIINISLFPVYKLFVFVIKIVIPELLIFRELLVQLLIPRLPNH